MEGDRFGFQLPSTTQSRTHGYLAIDPNLLSPTHSARNDDTEIQVNVRDIASPDPIQDNLFEDMAENRSWHSEEVVQEDRNVLDEIGKPTSTTSLIDHSYTSF